MLLKVFKKDVNVIRKSNGFFDQNPDSENFGKWIQGQEETFTIKANVQPLPGDITQTLPEGYREKSSFLIFTNTELFGVQERKENPDIVIINNQNYFIFKKKSYIATFLAHYELLAIKN